jgi:hypothetical protein
MSSNASSSSLNVVVHPLVLLSVVDHATRAGAADSKRRVVGMLLGQNDGKTINVSNSFAGASRVLPVVACSLSGEMTVPFEEGDAKTFFIDADYIENMYSMTKKVSGESSPQAGQVRVSILVATSSGEAGRLLSFWSSNQAKRLGDQRSHQEIRMLVLLSYARRAKLSR